jgi:hypothetical protein
MTQRGLTAFAPFRKKLHRFVGIPACRSSAFRIHSPVLLRFFSVRFAKSFSRLPERPPRRMSAAVIILSQPAVAYRLLLIRFFRGYRSPADRSWIPTHRQLVLMSVKSVCLAAYQRKSNDNDNRHERDDQYVLNHAVAFFDLPKVF